MKTHYWKTDIYRCFCSWQILFAIIGVCMVHFFIPQQLSEPRISVLQSFNRAWGSNAMVVAYIFTTFAYGQSFSEDLEQGYCKYAVIRGDALKYAMSKCCCIFLSSIVTMATGRMLFILFMKCRYPWEADIGEAELLKSLGCMTGLLEGKHYISYMLFHGIWQGFWAAVLALFSALISLYTVNRLLVTAFPVMAHHLLRRLGIFLSGGALNLDPDHIFLINYNLRNNELQSMIYAAVLGMALSLFLSILICRKFQRRMKNG